MLSALLTAAALTALGAASPALLETWPRDARAESDLAGADSAATAVLAAYNDVRSAGFADWDDSGGMYTVTRAGRLPQLHGVAGPGRPQRRLSDFPHRVDGIWFNPGPRKRFFLYTEDRGGDEKYRLGLYDLAEAGSDPRRLGRRGARPLAIPPGRVTEVMWGDSGRSFVYGHTPEGTDRWDLRLHTLGGRDPARGRDTLLFSRPGTWIPMDWSPDRKSLLVQKYVSASQSELHLFSLADGRLTPLLPGDKPGYYDHALWVRLPGAETADAVCFTSDRAGEFHRLYLYRPGRGAPRPVSLPAPWDVEWVSASADRRTLVYSLNEVGASKLHILTPGRGRARALKGIPKGIINGVRFRESGDPAEFAFTLNSPVFPGDVFSYRLGSRGGPGDPHGPGGALGTGLVRWTTSATAGLAAGSFREPELIRYATFDSAPSPGGGPARRRRIPAWLYLPPAGPDGRPAPVLVQIHGGPEQQARPGFDAFVQYAVARRGLAVIQPNVRGSTGYGKEYVKADDGYLRMHSVRDIGALLDWMRTRPDLDTARVAVAGRSYGGFMALSTLIAYGDRVRAGVSMVGITHFPTFLRNTSAYRRDLRRAEYGDERDPRMEAFLDGISPLGSLDRLRSPLLLGHGRNDPRVPYQESVRIFAALKTRRVPVWFLTFPEEGHSIRGPESQLLHYRVMEEFLERQLALQP